jgi:predicted permease
VTPPVRPPRLARALLGRCLPRDVRDDITGDLDEVFVRDCQAHGVPPARRRYWRTVASFGVHFLRDRITFRMRVPMSWIDFKLGFRMLSRYPGLSIIGGLAIAFAVMVGASVFQLVTYASGPRLPLEDGDRVVRVRLWYAASQQVETQAAWDFVNWRRDLTSVTELGAYRLFERNLIQPDAKREPLAVSGAEISASAFALARVRPLLGRTLLGSDERPEAPSVVVIGYDIWRSHFGSDASVVGRTVQLGSGPATIVGVMPAGFAFPVSQSAWIPMRLDLASYGRRQGPALVVFGRLAAGASLNRAQAELSALGARASADFPDTHEHIRPEVMPYTKGALGIDDDALLAMRSANVFVGLLLALVCGNVGLLFFARAATRESELLVRSALGAGRSRIVMQLFTEALVLGAVSAAVGLTLVGAGMRWALSVIQNELFGGARLPFWFVDDLAPGTIAYAALLTVFAAVIAGVVPALKITRVLDSRLRQTSAGGGGMRFGGVWTAVIVTQVALTVALPVLAYYVRRDGAQIRAVDVGFPAEEYLSVRLEVDPGAESRAEYLRRFSTSYRELERRLIEDPEVAGVAVAETLPRMYHQRRWIEVDEGGAAPNMTPGPGYRITAPGVDPDFFDVLGVSMIAGRGFKDADRQAGGQVAIVNESFVSRILGGRNPIGRRVRLLNVDESGNAQGEVARGPWYEVIGVVRDLGLDVEPSPTVAGFYRLLTPGDTYPVHMAVHVNGSQDAVRSRVRRLAAEIDPLLRVDRIERLDDVAASELAFIAFWFRVVSFVTAVTLTLSLAGIYAVMAFAVSRRTREIGIRVALGARPLRVLLAIMRGPLTQVGFGLLGGVLVVTWLSGSIQGDSWSLTHVLIIGAYGLLMTAVCALACIVPARRALRVEPTEALRAQ